VADPVTVRGRSESQEIIHQLLAQVRRLQLGEHARVRRNEIRASAIRTCVMVLSLAMARGRTTDGATESKTFAVTFGLHEDKP
jgi:hypothetical protein